MSNNFSYGNFNFSSLKEEEDDYAYEGEDFAPIRAFEEDSVHKLLCEGEEIPQKPLSKKEKFALKAKKNLYTSEKREIYKAEAKKVRNITKNCQW